VKSVSQLEKKHKGLSLEVDGDGPNHA